MQSINYNKALGICSPQERYGAQDKSRRWLPLKDENDQPYPWAVGKALDRPFHQWCAKRWMEKYKCVDIYQAQADVLGYFINNPERLEVRWYEYQEFMLGKFENAQTRLQNGLEIKDEEKAELRDNIGALTRGLPESSPLSLVAPQPIPLNQLPAQITPQLAQQINTLQEAPTVKVLPEKVEEKREVVYQLNVLDVLAEIRNRIPGKKQNAEPLSEIDDLNIQLADSVLLKEVTEAKLARFTYEVDANGAPCFVTGYRD